MNPSSKQEILGLSHVQQTANELTFIWLTENYICRRPRVKLTGRLLRLFYSNFEASGDAYAVRMYDEHSVNLLSGFTDALTENISGQVELRLNYTTGLYGPLFVDGFVTLEVEPSVSVEMTGTIRLLFEEPLP